MRLHFKPRSGKINEFNQGKFDTVGRTNPKLVGKLKIDFSLIARK